MISSRVVAMRSDMDTILDKGEEGCEEGSTGAGDAETVGVGVGVGVGGDGDGDEDGGKGEGEAGSTTSRATTPVGCAGVFKMNQAPADMNRMRISAPFHHTRRRGGMACTCTQGDMTGPLSA
jgi:hypothetical protein